MKQDTSVRRATRGLFMEPDDTIPTGSAFQNRYRQHCPANALFTAGLAEAMTLVFIAPTHDQLHALRPQPPCAEPPTYKLAPVR